VCRWWLGAGIWCRGEGLLAVAIVQTMPVFYGMSRQFMVDYGLATMAVMWMYYLLCSGLTSVGTVVRLGLLLGVGMLMKVTFPLYIGAPTIFAAWVFLRANRSWRGALKIVGTLGGIFLIGGLIASWWYIPNLKTVLGFALSASYGKLSVNYGMTNVFSWQAVSTYFFGLTVIALSSYYVALLLVLIPVWAIWTLWKHTKGTWHSLALLLWVIVPFMVTTFAVNKDARFTAPFLPAVALFLAHVIKTIFDRGRLYPAVAALLLIIPAFAYASASFPALERFGTFTLGRWTFWSPHLAWFISIPSSEGYWEQNEIAAELCRDVRQAPGVARLLLPLSHQYLNQANIGYMLLRRKCNVQIMGLPAGLQTSSDVAESITLLVVLDSWLNRDIMAADKALADFITVA
jgi:4-amino-4-deoxy-L-arabinose transferase-like glycosyltransferase